MIDEASIINRLRRVIPSHAGPSHARRRAALRIPIGIGDDAAVLAASRGCEWVVSTDSFIEGVHFLARLHSPDAAGYKALARATSDLAAMGATPRYFLLTLSLPAQRAGAWLDGFACGMARAARRFGMRLVGGDVSRHSSVAATLTVIGDVRRGAALTRSGARPGDALYVSGELGAAQAGLETLRREGARASARHAHSYSLARHLSPDPRLRLALWLARNRLASAAMDISDGLSTDLARLCEASGVGAAVRAASLPLVREPGRVATPRDAAAALERALDGGEDYELLFTVPHRLASRVPKRLGGVPITRIGEITLKRKLVLLNADGRVQPLRAHGWDHFRK
jgi:thiamine-monophosphate kinase